MTDPISIKIDSRAVLSALRNMAQASHNMAPAFGVIATELVSQTQERFASEGPSWPGLAASTIAQRSKHGHWPGQILQVSGQLAASVTSEHGSDFAQIGSAKVYAAIQQMGGDAGRGHKSHLPPRPFLPIEEGGNLTPEAEQAVLKEILDHLARSVGT